MPLITALARPVVLFLALRAVLPSYLDQRLQPLHKHLSHDMQLILEFMCRFRWEAIAILGFGEDGHFLHTDENSSP